MSASFRETVGTKVLSRVSADVLGHVSHLVVDVAQGRVTALVIGKGRKADLVDWDQITGFGPDAIIIAAEGAVRPPAGEREIAAAQGQLELVNRRALSDSGNELGTVTDVRFDTGSGRLEHVIVAELELPASALLGAGSYAAVVAAQAVPTTGT